jgi:RNA polymerase sigma-70 factor (ECF subfamily)
VSRFGKHLASGVTPPDAGASVTPADAGSAARPAALDELLPLAGAAARGDGDAAATLAAHVGGPMLRVIRKVLGRGHPDVDDVAQDAMIAFLGALGGFRGECAVTGFAQRIALLTALGARRRSRARAETPEGDGAGAAAATLADEGARSPLAGAVASRRRALVRRMLDDLPDVIAEALALHFVLGYTVDEIAAAVAVSPNTVWSRLRLGKQALRRRLGADERLREMLADADGGPPEVER